MIKIPLIQLIAHELGHTIGMLHDFVQFIYDSTNEYVYRTYSQDSQECRGLMDYIDDGVGWSKCSASDFTRILTNGGKKKPCLPLKGNICNLNVYFYNPILKKTTFV